jgi:hypothetical protein
LRREPEAYYDGRAAADPARVARKPGHPCGLGTCPRHAL